MTNLLFDALFAAGAADASALVSASESYTYGSLKTATAQVANALVAAGIHPGDRVAAQVEKSTANLILYLATLRAGGVFLPLNTAYTLSELDYFLSDAEPVLIVCDPDMKAGLENLGRGRVETLDAKGRGSLWDLARDQVDDFATVARGPEDLAAICYTSGTTGRSKGAMLSHRALHANATTLVDLWRFTATDVLIHALPIYHVHGLFVATHVAMMAGASTLLHAKFSPDAVLRDMPSASCFMGVPTYFTRLLSHAGLSDQATAGMRLFVSGSAPLLAETHRQWSARTGHDILERYGMTETGMNTSNPYDGDRIPGTVGRPLPDVEVRIVEPETGRSLEIGDVGGIEVKGPNLFSGYWRMPEKTATEFRSDGFFITGDLGRVDERGYISIVGRGKDLIISGGLNVYPKEIETLIDGMQGVVESAVVGLPHADLGEAVTAIVATGEQSHPSEAQMIAALSNTLARFKQPRRVIFVSELPRNPMGKVQKALLRDQYADLYA